MVQREKALILLTLSGPIVYVTSVVTFFFMPEIIPAWITLSALYLASLVLAPAGFIACIVFVVSHKNAGRPKLRWILFGSLDCLFVFPAIGAFVTSGQL